MKTFVDSRITNSERGIALITSLMLLAFLTLVGGALLSSATIDMRIGRNYQTNDQLLFVTEAGIAAAGETLRIAVEDKITASSVDRFATLPEGLTAVLNDYAGPDFRMSTALDADTLLNAGENDDVRYADAVPVRSGETTIGTYTVFIRNDAADGVSSHIDSNEVVTLVSIGVIGQSEMLIAVDMKKGRFPTLTAALTMDGPVPARGFAKSNPSNYRISGSDAAGGPSAHAIGVIDNTSYTNVANQIASEPDASDHYCGKGTTFTVQCDSGARPGPDVEEISAAMDPRLMTAPGLNAIVAAIESNLTSTTCPSGSVGSVWSPVVVVVTGDCIVSGAVTGWGQIVVKGALTMGANVEWNGLVLVVDPAECDTVSSGETHYAATLSGDTKINGGLFIASTNGSTLSEVCLAIDSGGSGGITYDSEKIRHAAAGLPFTPIATRHH